MWFALSKTVVGSLAERGAERPVCVHPGEENAKGRSCYCQQLTYWDGQEKRGHLKRRLEKGHFLDVHSKSMRSKNQKQNGNTATPVGDHRGEMLP